MVMEGKTVLLTGGNTGIGKAAATALAVKDARVVFTARSAERAEPALAEIRKASDRSEVEWVQLDLANLRSVRRCASEFLERFERLDVLINNAGGTWSRRELTDDCFEATFGVNHLGHFELTRLLLDRLRANAPSRILNVASSAHWMAPLGLDFGDLQSERFYDSQSVYAKSKLANIYFTRELARRVEGSGVTCNSLCPGFVATELGSGEEGSWWTRLGMRMARPFAQSPEQGARTVVYLASADRVADVNGQHFMFQRRAPISPVALSRYAAERLWVESEKLVGGAERGGTG